MAWHEHICNLHMVACSGQSFKGQALEIRSRPTSKDSCGERKRQATKNATQKLDISDRRMWCHERSYDTSPLRPTKFPKKRPLPEATLPRSNHSLSDHDSTLRQVSTRLPRSGSFFRCSTRSFHWSWVWADRSKVPPLHTLQGHKRAGTAR